MNIKELAEETSGPVRAALLALEAKVMMLEHDLAKAIEQHKAFKQEVSDGLVWYFGSKEGCVSDALRDFIIPKPKLDPLVAVMKDLGWKNNIIVDYVQDLRAALEARGLEIRNKNDV